ncbi:glycosyltransferase [Aeromonas dhakensis]|uniref:glycosyltransferase n=1 Tax=Aeromonas dhakensis TaxID=196024 RepID=UPI001B3A030B|nr:glycosyltransferase [Aeromonas dhakensis]MBQ4672937.1 glycosyltransferase [Aeromonas dhakensis]
MPTIFNMKARQKKKFIKKNIEASIDNQTPNNKSDISVQYNEKHLLILKEKIEQLQREVVAQKEHLTIISRLSEQKQHDYLKPLISENRQLILAAEKNGINKSTFDAFKEHIYKLERKNYELLTELEKEKERTYKAKNSISFLLGNTLIMYRKNNENIISLLKKLTTIKKIAKARRSISTNNVVHALPTFTSSLSAAHNYDDSSLRIISTLSDDEYIKLDKKPSWFSFTPNGSEEIKISFTLHSKEKIKYKDVLARITYLGINGEELSGAIANTYISATVGRYVYLDVVDNENTLQLILTPPLEVGSILIGLQTWQSGGEITISNRFNLTSEKITSISNEIDQDFLSLEDGVSIIVPSFKGNETIPPMLDSIVDQTISKSLIQLIIIINGDDKSSFSLYEDFKNKNNDINVIIHHDPTPSASNARNVAIGYANRKYTLFLDNDDMLTENYIQALYDKRSPNSIVICGIHDINERGDVIKDTPPNNQYLLASKKQSISYNDVTAITTMIACKLLPTHNLKKISFAPHLRSGEDVVFFCDYMSKFKPKITAVPESDSAFYIRRITQNSVSRQKSTFDFCVRQRLQVIKELKSLQEHSNDKEQLGFIQSKINAQSTFIKNFLSDAPEHKEELILELKRLSLEDFSYEIINRGKAKSLIISYCFPPYVDTSACVMAKRLRAEGKIVDVVHNNMSKVRNVSNDLNLLVNDLIEQRKIVNTPSTFANWSGIYSFALETLKWATRKQSNYDEIYSRAMWPASHFAAFIVKQAKPDLKWTAEFSDPILWDIKSKERYSKLDLDFINSNVYGKSKEIDSLLLQYKDNDNLYFWCEILPYIYANEIIFTCTNQRDYMLSMISDDRIKNIVLEKSIISQHPTLEPFYYNLGNADYPINQDVKNIGYFGAFYSKRNLDDVVQALKHYKNNGRKDIVLHVFTEQQDEAISFVKENGLTDYIKINGYLDYLDFLKVINVFDCLIVNDSIVKKEKGINPYLPSKLSDYMGVNSAIWSIVESDSALSKSAGCKYISQAGDINAATNILEQISKESFK